MTLTGNISASDYLVKMSSIASQNIVIESGYDVNGFDSSGINKDTSTKYDVSGYDIDGYDINGYDIEGFDLNGKGEKICLNYKIDGGSNYIAKISDRTYYKIYWNYSSPAVSGVTMNDSLSNLVIDGYNYTRGGYIRPAIVPTTAYWQYWVICREKIKEV